MALTPEQRQKRMDELKAEREKKAAEKVAARAATDPKLDPTNRPEGQINQDFIIYNSWVGGATTGEWRTYRVPNTAANMEKYGSRVFPGDTQQAGGSAVGANALEKQPLLVKDPYGNIIGYEKDGRQFTISGFSDGNKNTGNATGNNNAGVTPTGSSNFRPTGNTGGTVTPTTFTAPDGTTFTDAASYNNYINQQTAERKSAYDLLYQQFAKYGLQGLVTPLESLIKEGVPASEFAIRLRETDAYQKRFAANKARINKGLAALSEAEYIGLEDAYQGIMRQYGMPESYYTRGDMGRQEGFEKFIAGDVSPAELETRISTAYNRVINSNPEVVQSLKQFYPNITNGDILAYALDPEKALTDINKKVTAAEIGGAALTAGLGIDVARAEQLGAFGVSKAQAQQGYQTIADILPSAKKLSDIYAKQGLGPYNQAVAEQEVFGISGAADAAAKRRKLTQLETAQFSGSVGAAGGALGRERAGQF